MDGLTLTLWIAVGAFIGGVVTPLVAESRQFNDWQAMVLGTVVGAVGNLVLLLPLWFFLGLQSAPQRRTGPAWQADAITLAEAEAAASEPGTPLEAFQALQTGFIENFWPKARPAGEHSHRMTYVGVFVALAVVTAIEVVLSVADFGFDPVIPLVLLSTAKVVLVVLFFMHLRYDYRWYSWLFAFSLPFAILVTVVLVASI